MICTQNFTTRERSFDKNHLNNLVFPYDGSRRISRAALRAECTDRLLALSRPKKDHHELSKSMIHNNQRLPVIVCSARIENLARPIARKMTCLPKIDVQEPPKNLYKKSLFQNLEEPENFENCSERIKKLAMPKKANIEKYQFNKILPLNGRLSPTFLRILKNKSDDQLLTERLTQLSVSKPRKNYQNSLDWQNQRFNEIGNFESSITKINNAAKNLANCLIP